MATVGMTPLSALITASGLSQEEAARFLRLSGRDSVARMLSGKQPTPPGVLAEMAALLRTQMNAAANHSEAIESIVADGAPVTIGYPVDDHEAQAAGLPTVSAWRAMTGLMLADLPAGLLQRVRFAPRGSTPETALAADQRDGT